MSPEKPARRRPGLAVPVALLLAASCGAGAPAGERAIAVFGAASLTEPFGELGRRFEDSRPGTAVRFSFAGSQEVVAQILEGAEADAAATADADTMQRLADAGEVAGRPEVFARSELEIVVARGNPTGIRTLADLQRPGLIVVLADEQVPAGRYTARVLARAGVRVRPASKENNVKAVVTKVAIGEADAGVAYATDVRAAAGRVEGVAIPAQDNVVTEYQIAVLRSSSLPGTARVFVEFVLSPAGEEVLRRFGFKTP